MSLSELLKNRVQREIEQGASLRSIAIASDIAYPSLHRWVSGQRGIGEEALNKLAEHFGLTLCEKKKGQK